MDTQPARCLTDVPFTLEEHVLDVLPLVPGQTLAAVGDRHLLRVRLIGQEGPLQTLDRDRLREVNPDMLAPRDALELLYELRDLLGADAEGDR